MTEWLVRRFVKDHQNTGNVQVRTVTIKPPPERT